jgi:transposase, IS6 family
VRRFTPLFADAARPLRHAAGDRWFFDETYVQVVGRWRYLYWAVDPYGQVIDLLLSEQRRAAAVSPTCEYWTSWVPAAMHITDQYANNRVEADHGRLKATLRPTRGLERSRSVWVIACGHAFVQNLRRGHYELAVDVPRHWRLAAAFTEPAVAV